MRQLASIATLVFAFLSSSEASAANWWLLLPYDADQIECWDELNARAAGKHRLRCNFDASTIVMEHTGTEYTAELAMQPLRNVKLESVGWRAQFSPTNQYQPCYHAGSCDVHICHAGQNCVDITSSFVLSSGTRTTTGLWGSSWSAWSTRYYSLSFGTKSGSWGGGAAGDYKPPRYDEWDGMYIEFNYVYN